MTQRKKTPRKNELVDISFRCTTPGPDVETGTIRGFWTGEIDAWGKYTIQSVSSEQPTVYLFPLEIKTVDAVGDDEVTETEFFNYLMFRAEGKT